MVLETRELYRSSNGDGWLLARESQSGRVLVRHVPNIPSGGKTTDIEIGAFLCERSYGPQHMERRFRSPSRDESGYLRFRIGREGYFAGEGYRTGGCEQPLLQEARQVSFRAKETQFGS
jgi:hypothetical protein